MYERIENLSQSCCYNCDKVSECDEYIHRNLNMIELKFVYMARKDFDYNKCPIHMGLVFEYKGEEE